ncbi:MAG: DUF1552 domain-containing protein [Deltaproteobacteria bacterium]|nr:DUF1552 domain-containing protein [Deltaproteobacteria bacterium]
MQRQRRQRRAGRREFLKGLGLSAAAMPFIPMLESRAGGQAFPLRLVVFCTTTGMTGRYPDNWAPVGTVDDFTMSPILAPLSGGDTVSGVEISNLVGDCQFLQGVDMASYYDSPNVGGHPRGMGSILTGTPIMDGSMFSGGGNETAGWAGGITVDQEVANIIGQDTPFSSLELGVDNFGGVEHLRYVLSYKGEAQPLPVESDPYAAFDRIFGDLALNPEQMARLRAERLSVIDFLDRDLARIDSRVSAADRNKIEAHVDAVRGIEQRLTNGVGANCEVPDIPGGLNPNSNAAFPEVGRAQMDMLVAALACGVTNVGSIMWGGAPYGNDFSWVDGVSGNDTFHSLSHAATNNAGAQDQLEAISRWYTQQFAYFVQRLKDIPEGDGTLLDNTMVLWVTENARSNNHSGNNMPYVIAGRAGGSLTPGRFLTYDSVPHNQLLVSVCQAMGHGIEQFGDPQYGSGGLVGLV